MNPFDIIKDISSEKKQIINKDNQREYNSFIVNRGLSYFQDTLYFAQEMNKCHHLDNIMQYDYLFNSIRKSKRFSKWSKKDKEDNVSLIQEYYGFNKKKAEDALKVLNNEQIALIKERLERGPE